MTSTPPDHAPPHADAADRLLSPAARRSRIAGFVIGVVLLGAAALAIWKQHDALASAWSNLNGSSGRHIAIAVALPMLSLLATSTTFWILTRRYGRVALGEMTALLASAWLLNYLPLWPGMIGRLTYHKKVNNIAVRDSAKTLIWANVLNVVAAVLLLISAGIALLILDPSSPLFLLSTLTPVMIILALAIYAKAKRPAHDPEVWRIIVALGVRLIEHHLWAARFYVCFALVGAAIPWGAAVVIAGFTALATAIPITGNSLGVREWAVGIIASLLPAALAASTVLGLETGLTADLVNRALELAVAVPIGLASAAWLARRYHKNQQEEHSEITKDPTAT